jgi:hypothetical protein
MAKSVSSMTEILGAMPRVRKAVREDIKKRIAAGEEIYHARDGRLMINDSVKKALEPQVDMNRTSARRQAA